MSTTNQLCHLPYKVIQITGPDALSFLQGQVTADVYLGDRAKLAAHCNLKGRIVSLFLMIPCPEGLLLIAESDMADLALAGLKKYAVFSKVNFEILTTLAVYAQWDLLDPATTTPWLTEKTDTGYVVHLPTIHACRLILDNTGIETHDSYEAFRALLIQSGLPSLSTAISEHFLPHDINLPSLEGVSFKKGCYLGQEIISRMHFKASIKRHLAVYIAKDIKLNAPFSTNTPLIFEEKEIGSVVESAILDGVLYLSAMVNDEHKDHATIGSLPLVHQPLPYKIID